MTLLKKWSSIEISFKVDNNRLAKKPEIETDDTVQNQTGYKLFRVCLQTFNNNRDIDFRQFRQWCQSLYYYETLRVDNLNCEIIADELSAKIHQEYPGREMKISIYENGENGSVSHYKPDFLS